MGHGAARMVGWLCVAMWIAACGHHRGGGGGSGSDGGVRHDAGGTGTCSGTCEECAACAEGSAACRPDRDACMADSECTAFIVCAGETDDAARIAMCRTMHPSGADHYCAYFDCAFSEQCGTVCTEPAV